MPNQGEIEKRIVELRFENKQFTDATKETMKALDDLDKSLENTGTNANAFDHLSKSLNSLNLDSLSRMSENVESIGKHFTWFGRTVDHYADEITHSIAGMAQSGISSLTSLYNKYLGFDPNLAGFDEYEKKMGSIQTILTNTASKGTTLDEVTAALDDLNHYADKTIYNFQEMTRNIGTFTAAGVSLEDATAAIKGISNLAAGVGSTPQQAANAMYQLSQALAAGTVTLQDWNSVVNAGMGGEYFQNALKETARQIAEAKGIAYETFEGTFRESISGKDGTGWLTSEVLLETLKKFANDPALEDAATRVKTWSQLIDTMGESVQSGWAQSWEYVIGDIDEASDFFTAISNGFNDIVGSSAEARNGILKFWHDNGGRDQAIKSLQYAFEALYRIFKPIKTAWENVFPPLGQKRFLGLSEQILNFTSKLLISETTMERIANVTHIVAVSLKALLGAVKVTAKGVVTILTPAFKIAGKIIGTLVDSAAAFVYWLERFVGPVTDAEQSLTGVSKSATLFERAVALGLTVLKRIGKGFINAGSAAADFARQLGLGRFVDYFITLGKTAKDFISNLTLADLVDGFKMAQSKVDEFFSVIGNRFPLLGKFFNFIRSFIPSFTDISNGIKEAGGLFQYLQERLIAFKIFATEKITWVWGKLFSKEVESEANGIRINTDRIFNFLGRIKDGFIAFTNDTGPLVNKISNFFKPFVDILVNGLVKIKDDLGELDFNDLISALLLIRGWFMTESIMGAFDGFGAVMEEVGFAVHSISDAITGFVESATGIFDGVGDTLKAFRNDANANALLKIAAAIAILAGSVFLLSKVKFENGMESLFTLGSLVAIMLGSMWVLSKLTNDEGEMSFDAKPFLIMAASVMLIVKAIKDLTELAMLDMNAFNLAAGYIATGIILLAGVQGLLSKFGGTNPGVTVRAAIGMVIMVKAIESLVQQTVTLATLVTAGVDLKSGIENLIGIMLALGTFFLLARNIGGFGIRAAIGIVILTKCLSGIFDAFSSFETIDFKSFIGKLAEASLILASIGSFLTLVSRFGNAKGILAIGTSFLMIGSGIWVIAQAINSVANSGLKASEVEQVIKALSGLIYATTAYGVLMTLFKADAAAIGAGFVMVAGGLWVMTKALGGFAAVDWGTLEKAGVALAAILAVSALVGYLPKIAEGFEKLTGMLKDAGIGILAFAGGIALLSAMLLFAAPLFVLLAAQMSTIVDALIVIGKGVIEVIVSLSGPIAEACLVLIYEVLYYLNSYIVPISNELALLIDNLLTRTLPKVLDALGDGIAAIALWLGKKVWQLIELIADLLAMGLDQIPGGSLISGFFKRAAEQARQHQSEADDLLEYLIDERAAKMGIQRKLDRIEVDANKAVGSWTLNDGVSDAKERIGGELESLTTSISLFGNDSVAAAKQLTEELSDELKSADAIIAFNAETNALELKQNELYGPLPPKRMAGRAEAYELLKKKLQEYNYELRENQSTGAIELVKDVGSLNSALGVATTSISNVSSTYGDMLKLFEGGEGIVPVTFDMNNPLEAIQSLSDEYGISVSGLLNSASEDGNTLGSNLINGIIEAYSTEGGGISEKGADLISQTISAMNAAAEIHSPSDKTYDTAHMMILGIVNGFKDGEATVFWSAYNAANAGVLGTRNAFAELSSIFDNSFDYNPTITPVLDVSNVQNGLWWLNSQFSGTPTFTVAGNIQNESPFTSAVQIMDERKSESSGIIDELQSMRNDILWMGEQMSQIKVFLDTGTLVGEMSAPMDTALGQAQRRSVRSGRF